MVEIADQDIFMEWQGQDCLSLLISELIFECRPLGVVLFALLRILLDLEFLLSFRTQFQCLIESIGVDLLEDGLESDKGFL